MKILGNISLLDSIKYNYGIKRYCVSYTDDVTHASDLIQKEHSPLAQAIKDKYDAIKNIFVTHLPVGTWVTDIAVLKESIDIRGRYTNPTTKEDFLLIINYADLTQAEKNIFDDFINHVKTVDLI